MVKATGIEKAPKSEDFGAFVNILEKNQRLDNSAAR